MTKTTAKLLLGLALGTTPWMAQAVNLHEVYQQALENEHQLKADQASYRAGLQARQIGMANVLPQIAGQAQYSDAELTSRQIGGITFDEERSAAVRDTTYAITLTQPLFDLNAWFTYRQGVKLSKQAEAQYAADEQSFIIRVANAYFDVLRSADVLDNSIAREKALKHQLEQTQQRFEVGLTAITDVHDAQATYDGARAETLSDLNDLGIAYDALEVITGTSPEEVSGLTDDFPVTEPVPANRSEWVDFALANNNVLKSTKLAAEAARQTSRAATSNHIPTVEAQLFGTDNHNYEGTFDNEQTGFTVTLNVPIFSGGRVSASRRQAAANYQQAQEAYLQTKRETIQAARSQHLSVLTDVATVSARAQAIVSSESSLEATQAGYEVGTRDFVDVLNAQQGVFQARSDYYNALYNYIIDTLVLKQTAGTLGPQDIIDLNQWLDASKAKKRSDYE